MTKEIQDVMMKIDGVTELTQDLFTQAVLAMKAAFPAENFADAERLFEHDRTEAVLHLVEEHLHEWNIALKGRGYEGRGEWDCTFRKSGSLDDNQVIGIGTGRTLSLAVLATILRASLWRISNLT